MAKRVSIEERILEYFRVNSGLPSGELMFNLVRAEIVRGREITGITRGKKSRKNGTKKPAGAGKKSANLATVGGGSSGSRRRPSEGDAEDAARSIGTGG